MSHHLILVREIDEQMSGSGCCGRVQGDLTHWVGGERPCFFPERREMMNRVGAIYRRVKAEFGDAVRITVLDPRNQVSFLPLVMRDAMHYRVPLLTALRTVISASVCTGVFDGQVLFRRDVPSPEQVVELIRGRMRIYAVGAAPPAGGGDGHA